MRRSLFVVASVLASTEGLRSSRAHDCYSKYDGQPLVKLTVPANLQQKVSEELIAVGCTELSEGEPELFAICSHGAVGKLTASHGRKLVDVVEKDAGKMLRDSSGVTRAFTAASGVSVAVDNSFYSNWRSYQDRMQLVNSSVSVSGGVCKLEVAGTSVEGRPIYAVRLTGQGYVYGRPRVVANFQLHAREWIPGMAGVYAVEKACEMAKADPSWLSGIELVIIPNANPDGTIYSETSDRMWRKNRRINPGQSCRGVDLNRNWDPHWAGPESTSTYACSDTFVGSGAFSEPETQAVKGILDEAPVSLHLDVHAYSAVILAPWSYQWAAHPDRDQIDVVGMKMLDAVKAAHGHPYRYGGNELLSPASGVCPDYSTSIGAWGFTYELMPAGGRNGFAPPKTEILPSAEECWAGIAAGIAWTKDQPNPTVPPPTPAPPPPTNFVCDDGCDINDSYMNDGFCDCGNCEDEDSHTCSSCGGCPTYCGGYKSCR